MVKRQNDARASQRSENRKSAQKPAGKTNIISFRESDIIQRWLITTEGCPTCAQIKKDYRKEFASGKLKATDVGDEKGFEILTTLGLQEAPVFIIELRADHPSGVKYIIDE